jgi:tripartite-type tricarboxylate transporter receptor subunit TctC
MEALKMQTGIRLRHVPYKTVPQILNDMQGGVVRVAFVDTSSSLPLLRAGSCARWLSAARGAAPPRPRCPR